MILRADVGGLCLLAALEVAAADQQDPEQAQDAPQASQQSSVLLIDRLGNAVEAPESSLAPWLRASSALGLKYQTPATRKGARRPSAVGEKVEGARENLPEFELFPAAPPQMMPYLYSNDQLGNTAAAPGALIGVAPLEPAVQGAKYWSSDFGLRYTIQQAFNYAGMTHVMDGSNSLANYDLHVPVKWTVFDARAAETAGWISAEIEYESVIGSSSGAQTARTNLGTVTNPTGLLSERGGFSVPELAWQQSFDAGHVVVVAGVVDQGNYLDANAYANSARGQFMNSALGNSGVLPLAANDYGLNLQWQPRNDWYTLLGYSVGNASAGQAPGTHFSWQNWSLEWEAGYTPSDLFGLGPGVYRIQPFLARNGSVQGGLAFNLQQQLGRDSPFGWFGRFGAGGYQVSAGSRAQVGTGFVMQAPLKYAGWAPHLSNDQFGIGFVWSQPSATTKTVYHNSEHILEAFYTLQLTPMSQLQPDLQIVWDPAFNPRAGPSVVSQIQLLLQW